MARFAVGGTVNPSGSVDAGHVSDVANASTTAADKVTLDNAVTAVTADAALLATDKTNLAADNAALITDAAALAAGQSAVAADVATLVADGATPTQAHVNTLNTDWGTLNTALTTFASDWATATAHLATADTDLAGFATHYTTLTTSVTAYEVDIAPGNLSASTTNVILSFDAAAVGTKAKLRTAVEALLRVIDGSNDLT